MMTSRWSCVAATAPSIEQRSRPRNRGSPRLNWAHAMWSPSAAAPAPIKATPTKYAQVEYQRTDDAAGDGGDDHVAPCSLGPPIELASSAPR